MFPAQQIISDFQMMYNDRWGYIPGSSGQLWTQAAQDKKALADPGVAKYGQQWVGHKVADCSGAFVNSYRQHGLTIYHGSNRIAREYVVELLPPSYARPGMAAFKAYKPGDKYYALPSEYKPGGAHYNGNLFDYYHIGLVDDDPAYVINAASTKSGVKRSKLSDNWCAVGYLKAVQYDNNNGEETPMTNEKMVVNTNNVNLRSGPSGKDPRIKYLQKGDIVTIQQFSDLPAGWSFVHDGKTQGYMMSKYLSPTDEKPAEQSSDNDEVLQWLSKALEAHEQEGEALEKLQLLLTGALG